jgi:DNA transformation protein and related proteins
MASLPVHEVAKCGRVSMPVRSARSARYDFGAAYARRRRLFLGGTTVRLIAPGELFLTVGDINRSDYLAAGEAPFSYEIRHGLNRIYWHCPPDLLDDTETFQAQALKATEVTAAAAGGRSKASSRRV